MRYSDRSGGLSGTERQRRQALRLRAADMFRGGVQPPRVAQLLGVTRKSACEWHRAWLKGGKSAPASKGAAGTGCKLTNQRLPRLEALLDEGAIAHGWDDQRWTSARIAVPLWTDQHAPEAGNFSPSTSESHSGGLPFFMVECPPLRHDISAHTPTAK